MSVLGDVKIFYGEATSTSAHVYAQIPRWPEWSNPQLQGVVRGPRAEGIRTLPTTTDFVDLGPGDSLLAGAIVPDPGFWSPDVPAVYDVEFEVRDQSGVVEAATGQLGIRQFGARGTNWYFGGRRWVLRGLIMNDLPSDEVDFFRSTNACVAIADPHEKTCEIASRRGVILVPVLRGDAEHVRRELRRLSCWPATALAMIDAEVPLDADLKSLAPNVELVQLSRQGVAEETVSKWASGIAGLVDDPARFGRRFDGSTAPVLAIRGTTSKMDVSGRRAACDRLQLELAPHGDYAGYIV